MGLPTESTLVAVNECPTKQINESFGQADSTFKIITKPIDQLKTGEVLVKNLLFSNDPSQRAWIQKNINKEGMYVEPIRENGIMRSFALVQIVQSKSEDHKVGEIYMGTTCWGDYVVAPASSYKIKIDTSIPLPLTAYLDYIGGTGLTAYFAMFEVFKLTKDNVLVVSGAAGATGSMVVQIAKNVIGAKKVIGIAGGPEKCDYVKSLGADECVDYKKPNFFENMKQALGEDKHCDVYFDGVGGEILDQMFLLTKQHGTIIACGSVAGYNDSEKSNVKNWGLITVRRLNVKGFIVLDFAAKFQEGIKAIISYVQQGKIKTDKDTIHLVDVSTDPEPFKQFPNILNMLFNGEKKAGKLITKLADPEEL